jgi:uncharacterized membrane protein (UPF0127 family)
LQSWEFSVLTRRLWFVGLICLALTLAGGAIAQPFKPHEPLNPAKAQSLPLTPLAIESGGKLHRFQVEVAETEEQQELGLMHRAVLAKDHGMLFTYTRPARVKYWMRNTFIPLDILFMRGDGSIAYIAKNVQPHDERPVGPEFPVVAVLELQGGLTAHLKIKEGDILHHALFGNMP